MKYPAKKHLWLTLAFVMAIVVLGFPLLVGVWLPDVFIDRIHTLADQRLGSGHSFRVIQYWNHGDFYNTEFQHTGPDGAVSREVLDGDDSKRWRATLTVDEHTRRATVALRGRKERNFTW
jgi:hypothetical protein